MILLLVLSSIIVGTWNGNWFPSGRAEHRAHPDVEAATISAAARMLRAGFNEIDPCATNDIILCLHEMRGPTVASDLVSQIGRKGLKVAIVSGYRRRDRFDMQQDVIATTLPVSEARWHVWSRAEDRRETPPRGYAFAAVVLDASTTASVYAVHLKSNYGTRNNRELADLCRRKRTLAIHEVIELEKLKRGSGRRSVIIAGDFNADRWRKEFAAEEIFESLESAGYDNLLSYLPAKARGTYPNKRYGDSALDYIMVSELLLVGQPRIIPNDQLSDHCAVFAMIRPR